MTRRPAPVFLAAFYGALMLPSGCGGDRPGPQPLPAAPDAAAELRDSTGAVVGTALLREEGPAQIAIEIDVHGLSPGEHGVHLHAVGRCEALPGEGAFTAAGGHFNPAGREHGLENPQGAHAGDLPNLVVGADGTGTLRTTTDRVTLAPGPLSVYDEDGTAIVVHAGPDDQITDPSGDSGARVACGVLVRR